jgi:hypothetical protein
MINKVFIFLFAVLSISYSQQISDSYQLLNKSKISNSFSDDLKNSLNSTFEVIKSPLSFDRSDFLMTSLVAAMTGAAFSLDDDIKHDVAKTKSKSLDNISYFGEKFGRPVYPSILGVLLYSGGFYTNDKELKVTGQILIETMITTGLFTQVLKSVFGRARPFMGDQSTDIDFFEFEFEKNENSLPSGHTSIAFATATVLSERLDNIFASIALYSLASLTAFQRIYSNVHWFSDTVLGAALGTFIGLKLVKIHEQNPVRANSYQLNIFPEISPSGYGVGFSIQF